MNNYSDWLINDGYAIFLLHGVIPRNRHAVRNYTVKHITVDRFETFLQDLLKTGRPVSMNDIVQATEWGGKLPPKAFAITFDDGFENNCSVAAPVLRKYKVPATFYVTTGFLEHNSGSWIDQIEYAVEKTHSVKVDLPSLNLQGVFSSSREKIQLLDKIRQHVKSNAQVDPYEFATDFCGRLGVSQFDPDPDLDQKMSWDQLREMSRDSLFTIGGHGETHRILDFLGAAELQSEIENSVRKLTAELGYPVTHYSYPEGMANCYSDRVIQLLKRHGIVCSPSAQSGVNHVGDDLFRLKRVMVI